MPVLLFLLLVNMVLPTWTDAASVGGGGGGSSQGLDSSFDVQNEINGATSANPLIIGNGTQKAKHYGDPTEGYVVEPVPLGDSLWRIWTNFNGCMKDMEANALVWCLDPDAVLTKDKYLFQSATYMPYASGWFPASNLDGDGTNCPAKATTVTLNNGKLPTIICTSSTSSTIYGSVKMPGNWNAGAVYFSRVVQQTAADTNAYNGQVDMKCTGSTWGTAVAINLANVTGSGTDDITQTSSVVTPAGTCAAGGMLYWRYRVASGTTTAMATLHHIGFRVAYQKTSWSE